MNRIQKLFADKKTNLLSVFYTAGFPGLNDTVRIAEALEAAGADIIEIGIPFSDPVADGPTIQASNKIALDNGMTVPLLLTQVKAIRKTVSLPIILMGYLNPIMQYGVEAFARDAVAAGVDGLILPDMPLHEYEEQYSELFESLGLGNTFLISPTTSEDRIHRIDAVSHGFIYAVSSSSITGGRGSFTTEQIQYFDRLKNLNLHNPFLIGFGISSHETFAAASNYGAGAIVGSAFINLLEKAKDFNSEIRSFVTELKTAPSK